MAATDDEIRDAIRDSAAEGIQSVSVDGMTITERALKDRLDALQRLERDAAASRPHFGLRITKLIPPGAG